jgi:hypothetical protein
VIVGALTVILNVRSAVWLPIDDVALRVNVLVVSEATALNPLIAPLLEFNVAPDGNEPEVREYDIVPVPSGSDAATVNTTERPLSNTVPSDPAGVVHSGSLSMVPALANVLANPDGLVTLTSKTCPPT